MDKGCSKTITAHFVAASSPLAASTPPTRLNTATQPHRIRGGSSEVTLQVHQLRKRFRKVQALQDVSFALRSGERLALLGPNGAGKTTLIRCLAGLTPPDSGSIELLGARLPLRGGRERLGLVPQDIAIYADLTAAENLTAFGRFHGLRGAQLRSRVDWALQWTGLSDRRGELVGHFSGGMKRRVNLACGVMHAPRVLLLDEPTVGVDPQSRQRIFEMLDELREGGTSILLTTHHLDEAEQRCDRIVIVDHGQVVADGTLEQLVQRSVGSSRHVRVHTDRPVTQPLPPWQRAGRSAADTTCLYTRLDDVAGQLPQLLQGIAQAGYGVTSVEVHAPSLHDVFLHLTGQELRD